MRPAGILLSTVSLLCSVLLTIPFAAGDPPKNASASGRIVSVTGKVLIRNEDQPKDQVTVAKPGDLVGSGTVVNTSSSSSVKILMPDRTIVDIGPSTLFKMDEYKHNSGNDRQVSMSMEYGKIRSSVTQPVTGRGRFNVRTRSATMGVRGTEFIVKTDLDVAPSEPTATKPGEAAKAPRVASSRSEIVVVHGAVEVKETAPKAKPVTVNAGMQFTSVQGPARGTAEPPKVTQLSSAQLTAIKTESKLADTTFIQAVKVDAGDRTGAGASRGSSTLLGITETFQSSKDSFREVTPIGVPGMFGPGFFMQPNVQVPAGAPVSLKVSFKAN